MTVVPVLGDWEIPRIALMRTEEARKLAEHRVAGRPGSVFQDLGAESTVVEIAGSLHSEDERTGFMDEARARFLAAEPLTFVADITRATDIQYVVIDNLVLEQRGDRPDEIAYRIRLRESPPPPPPPDPFGAIDTSLLDQAAGFVDRVSAALDAIDALGDIPDFTDPSSLLGGATDQVVSALDGLASIGGQLQELFGG